jgi:hypothetical protein
MDLESFFKDLKIRAEALQKDSVEQKIWEPPGPYLKAGTLMSQIPALLHELIRPVDERTLSVIRSCWGSVVKNGKDLNLFEKYQGNEDLREQIRTFIKGK